MQSSQKRTGKCVGLVLAMTCSPPCSDSGGAHVSDVVADAQREGELARGNCGTVMSPTQQRRDSHSRQLVPHHLLIAPPSNNLVCYPTVSTTEIVPN